MTNLEIDENFNNLYRNKININNIFHKLNLKKDHLNKSFNSFINEKNDELISIYGNTGIENKKNLQSFLKEHHFYKENKKSIQNNIFRIIKYSEINKDNNNYNNNSNIYGSSYSLTNKNYKTLSNSNEKKYQTPEHSKFINPINNFETNSTNYNNRNNNLNKKMKESKSYYNKKVKLVLGNLKKKQVIDIEQLDFTNNSNKNKSLETTPRTNVSEERKKLFFHNDLLHKTEIISKKIKKIMKKNTKNEKKLNYILKDSHFFPYINESFNVDLFNIGNKEVIIKRPAKYKIKNFNIEEDMREKLKKYRIEKENYKSLIKLKNKNEKIKNELEKKINKDLVKANNLNIKFKFNPKNLDFYMRFINKGKKINK